VSANLPGERADGFRLGRRGAALLVIALLLAIGIYVEKLRDDAEARAAFPLEAGRSAVAGIAAPVEIYRDSRGIPHIQATNDLDAYFGWGFAHAQDRLAQMISNAGLGRARRPPVRAARRGFASAADRLRGGSKRAIGTDSRRQGRRSNRVGGRGAPSRFMAAVGLTGDFEVLQLGARG